MFRTAVVVVLLVSLIAVAGAAPVAASLASGFSSTSFLLPKPATAVSSIQIIHPPDMLADLLLQMNYFVLCWHVLEGSLLQHFDCFVWKGHAGRNLPRHRPASMGSWC